jgi:hypothetical protein
MPASPESRRILPPANPQVHRRGDMDDTVPRAAHVFDPVPFPNNPVTDWVN